MVKKVIFWGVVFVLILLLVWVVFLGESELPIDDPVDEEGLDEEIDEEVEEEVIVEEEEEIEEEELFEGNYTYVGLDNTTFEFEAIKKEGLFIVFHYFTMDMEVGSFTAALRNGPNDVEDILMEDVKGDISSKGYVYIVQDPGLAEESGSGSLIAANQLALNIGTYLGIDYSLRYNVDGYSSNPTVTCDDVTEDVAVVEYRLGETSIYSDDGCIILQAETKDDFYRVSDKFVMHLARVF